MEIEVPCNIDLSAGTKDDSQDQRLKDYSRRRASKQWNAMSAMKLDDNPFRNLQRIETPSAFGVTKKLDKALSTAEFLLGLPMDGEHELAEPMSMISIGGVASSRDKPDRKLSCTDRLKLSLSNLMDSKSELSVAPTAQSNSCSQCFQLDSDDDEDDNSLTVPPKRMTLPACKSRASLIDDDDVEEEEEEENQEDEVSDIRKAPSLRRVKSDAQQYLTFDGPRRGSSNIRFSLRRQGSLFKLDPNATALSEHSSATDWLHTSLKNLMIDTSAEENKDTRMPTLARSRSCEPLLSRRGPSGSFTDTNGNTSRSVSNKSLSSAPNNFKLPNRKRSISPMPVSNQSGRVLPSPSNSFREARSKRSLSPVPRQSFTRVLPSPSNSCREARSSKLSPLSKSCNERERKGSVLSHNSSFSGLHSSSRSLNSSSGSLNTSTRSLRSLTAAGLPLSKNCPQRGLQMLLKTAERRSGAGLASLNGSEHDKQPKARSSLQLSRLNASTSNMLNASNNSLLNESMHKPSRRPHASTASPKTDSRKAVLDNKESAVSLQPNAHWDSKGKNSPGKESSHAILNTLTSLNRSLSSRNIAKATKQLLPTNCPHPVSGTPKSPREKPASLLVRANPSSKPRSDANDSLKSTLSSGLASQAADRLAEGAVSEREFDFPFAPFIESKRTKVDSRLQMSDAEAMPPPPPSRTKTNRKRSKSPMGRSQSHPSPSSGSWLAQENRATLSRARSKNDLCLADQPPATRPRLTSQGSRRSLLMDGQGSSRRNLMVSYDTSASDGNDPSQFFVTGSRIRRYNSFA